MSQNLSQVDELAAAVRADPSDVDARRALVEALIDEDRISDAELHFDALQALAPEQPWVAQIDERLAEAHGDSIRAARARRQFRESTEQLEEDMASDDDPLQAHPSLEPPRLRLLTGGAEGPASQTEAHFLHQVAGLATVKAYISQILEEIHNTPGGMPGPWLGGSLFYGPPGCGKAFSASVIAGELGANFVIVNLSESWSPTSLRPIVHSIANAHPDSTTVLYLDGLDERFGADHAAAIEPMLGILDQARTKSCVAIFGSATVPWQVSSRIARPGRLGRVLLVLPPDAPARDLFLSQLFDKHGTSVSAHEVDWLSHQTEGHSFADLEQLVEMVLESGETTHASLRRAVQHVSPSSSDWLTTAGHHAMMNEAGGMYDDLLTYFRSQQRH